MKAPGAAAGRFTFLARRISEPFLTWREARNNTAD
jgi:hypothetical protein